MCKDGEPDGQTQLGTPWGHLLGLDEPIISNLGPYRAAALECLSPNRPTIYTVLVLLTTHSTIPPTTNHSGNDGPDPRMGLGVANEQVVPR